MTYREDYPLSVWLDDVAEIIKRRDFVGKKEALAGYGDDAFIEMFYKTLGKTYLQPHEKHLREFLKSIRSIATPILSRTDAARKAFNKE